MKPTTYSSHMRILTSEWPIQHIIIHNVEGENSQDIDQDDKVFLEPIALP